MNDLERRRDAPHRLTPLAAGCRDPWGHQHQEPRDVAADLDAWERAIDHLRTAGLEPIVPRGVDFAMRRRGVYARIGTEH